MNVLDALLWVKAAWDCTQPSTIVKCFETCGFTSSLESGNEDDIPLSALLDEDDLPLSSLLTDTGLTIDEYVGYDGDLATNETLGDNWDGAIWKRTRGIEIHTGDSDIEVDIVDMNAKRSQPKKHLNL